MGRHSKFDNMTKEEILELMRERSRRAARSQYKKTCTLTKSEGEKLETEILPTYNCENVSQLVKKIVRGELILSETSHESCNKKQQGVEENESNES